MEEQLLYNKSYKVAHIGNNGNLHLEGLPKSDWILTVLQEIRNEII